MVRCNGSSGIKAITAKPESLLFDEFVAVVCMVKNPEKEVQFLKNSHHPKSFEIRAKRESAAENIFKPEQVSLFFNITFLHIGKGMKLETILTETKQIINKKKIGAGALLFSQATDYRFTLVFLLKAQSRAMGNTADT